MKAIKFEDAFKGYSSFDFECKKNECLPNIAKINIFVGANNSGKSRFMRLLASTGKLTFLPNIDLDTINKLRKDIFETIRSECSNNGIVMVDDILSTANNSDAVEYIGEGVDVFADLRAIYGKVYSGLNLRFQKGNTIYNDQPPATILLQNALAQYRQQYEALLKAYPDTFSFDKLYIPSLRGLRGLQGQTDVYKERTSKDYFSEVKSPDIFSGLTLYEDIRSLLLGNLEERQIITDFQYFLSETFFRGQPVALIPRRDTDVLVVKIGNEIELPIHSLGDGIQSIIVLTFPLFKQRDKCLIVCIEEPEIYMHPSLQRILVNTLLKFDKHQYFFTTHSNHFLDLTLDYKDISIYTFEKKMKRGDGANDEVNFEIYNVSNDSRKPLELLGAQNSSVFLSNCTIWVEGVTDHKYIAHYLNKYQEHLKAENGAYELLLEDIHYSFVEYSGSNISHWSFLEGEDSINVDRLCGKLFLIADRDSSSSKWKAARHERLSEKLAERYYPLEVREIENLLSPEVIKKVVEEYEGDSIGALKFSSYKNKLLGKYIRDTILKGKQKRRGQYAEESGTLAQKVDFCKRALSHIDNFSDLTKEAKELTTRIHRFIVANNVFICDAKP